MLTAADRDVGTGHECRFIRGEIGDQSAISSGAARRLIGICGRDLAFEDFLRNRQNHLGTNVTREMVLTVTPALGGFSSARTW